MVEGILCKYPLFVWISIILDYLSSCFTNVGCLQDGKLSPFRKSEPIPEANNEPVKVVVADNVNDVVFKSGKNGIHSR